ncbi:MAG: VCBS repeat-containing protein [Planctomycetes bacterium]|nr:VCBS repeat-containing protein [Planctomycetota bacterium]
MRNVLGVSIALTLCFSSAASFAQQYLPIRFAPNQRFTVDGAISHVQLVDLDSDGTLDLVAQTTSRPLAVVWGRPGGFLSGTGQPILPRSSLGIGLGDFDMDGDLDVVAGETTGLVTYLNQGSRTFALGSSVAAPRAAALALDVADLDADGFLDVVMRPSVGAPALALYFGSGTGAFGNPVSVTLSAVPISFAAAELGGNSSPEIAATFDDGSVVVIQRTSGRSFTTSAGPAIGSWSRVEQVRDFDEDGFSDLLLVGGRSTPLGVEGQFTLLFADGSGGFRSTFLPYLGTDVIAAARIGSFDAIGPLDLLVVTYGDDILWERSATVSRRSTPNFPETPVLIAVGDVDRDGDDDVVAMDLRYPTSSSGRVWTSEARREIRLSLDETSGTDVWDSARGGEAADRYIVTGSSRWQGDPGTGREAFRGNDPGAGMLARGTGGSVSSSSENVANAAGPCTIAWWMRMGPQAPNAPVALLQTNLFTAVTGGSVAGNRLGIVWGPQNQPQQVTTATPIQSPGRWTHLACTVDVVTGLLTIWIDGIADPNRGVLSPRLDTSYGLVSLGASERGWEAGNTFFDFDEFRYFPRVLSASEIRALQSGNAATAAPMGSGCYERRDEEGLHLMSRPAPGGALELRLDTTGHVNGAALLLFGVSSSRLGSVSLPFDLGYGCLLRTSFEAIVPMATGRALDLSVPLPSSPGALQGNIYTQALIFGVGVQTTRAFDLKLHY